MPELDEKPVPLSSYLEPRLTAERLERNREAIALRLGRGSASRVAWGLGAVAAFAAVALWLWSPGDRLLDGQSSDALVAWEAGPGAVLVAEEAVNVTLGDGTRLDLDVHTTLATLPSEPNRFDLELRRGRASFDVAHNPQRQFRVHAGSVTVVVLGTRFSVTRTDGVVQVNVERGKVAVEREGQVTQLTPGQSWQGQEAAIVPPVSTAAPAASALGADGSSVEGPSAEAPSVEAPSVGSNEAPPESAASHQSSGASLKPNGAGAAASESELGASPAKELFDASREARRVGNSRQAAQLLQQLVGQYPKDPRAGLAAFELGRIRADVLGDTSGAIQAFEQALRLSPNGGFRQDALARLAQAYDRVGRSKDCQATRKRYLAAYGQGVHAQRMLQLCP